MPYTAFTLLQALSKHTLPTNLTEPHSQPSCTNHRYPHFAARKTGVQTQAAWDHSPKPFLLLRSPQTGKAQRWRKWLEDSQAEGERHSGPPSPGCIPRAGSLSPSPPFSAASLRCAAHPHIHQHAHPHAGVCQWLVSIPHPRHWACITAFDPYNHPEVGITIIVPVIQRSSERLRNFSSK